jgi:hypothetical protein
MEVEELLAVAVVAAVAVVGITVSKAVHLVVAVVVAAAVLGYQLVVVVVAQYIRVPREPREL